MIDIPCVILAGGKSSRMGEDKSLLSFGNFDTLVEYQYNKLSKIFQNIYFSTKNDKFDFLNEDEKLISIIYDNTSKISSPMIALDSIFNKLKDEKVFIITVDVPLIKKETIESLISKSDNFDVTIAKDTQKTHNLCGVFNRSIASNIKKLLNEDIHKINYLIKQTNNHQEVLFNEETQFININIKENYIEALKYL